MYQALTFHTSGGFCHVNFGISPFCMGISPEVFEPCAYEADCERHGLSILSLAELDLGFSNKYPETIPAAIDSIVDVVQARLIPFFEKATNCADAYEEIRKLYQLNQSSSWNKENWATPFEDNFVAFGEERFCMLLKLNRLDEARKMKLALRREEEERSRETWTWAVKIFGEEKAIRRNNARMASIDACIELTKHPDQARLLVLRNERTSRIAFGLENEPPLSSEANQSLYLHIPFCKTKCPYCDFYSVCDFSRQEAYVERCVEILREQNQTWRTAYIGGGTPSVLKPALLARLLAAIDCAGEFTIECNPSSVTWEFCRVIAEGGVNRVSLGLQSAVPHEREALGRTGGLEETHRALSLLHLAGIKNVSLDVMLGIPCIPAQNIDSLTYTLMICAGRAKHISAYLLKIEPGTPFYDDPPQNLPDEDTQAQLYLHACDWLEKHGFAQYEISNFAKPGFESQHNLNYWRCGEYFAIGPGAHGFTDGRRWHYERDLEGFQRGDAPVDDGPGGDFDERAMLALRLAEGFSQPSARMIERASALPGFVEMNNNCIKLTREGFLLSNAVIGKLLS